jgi:hypothetical protein
VAAPVIDHILVAAVLRWHALAPVKLVLGACATAIMTLVVVRVFLVMGTLGVAGLWGTAVMRIVALGLFVAVAVVAMLGTASLGEGQTGACQGQGEEGANQCFIFHTVLQGVGSSWGPHVLLWALCRPNVNRYSWTMNAWRL